MVNEKDIKECCGCGACVTICPHDAIALEEDCEGFSYPTVEVTKCTKCGLCDRACTFGKKPECKEPLCYVAQHKSETVCAGSTSGGMYTAFSDVILEKNGVIYSPDFSDDGLVIHKRIVSKEDRDHSRGSKYVQSLPNGFQNNLLHDLKEGRMVGFFGTPCQTVGVLSVVPEIYRERLYCIDVICNGVGSPVVLKGFLRHLEKKYHRTIDKYIFRPKTHGYLTSEESVIWKNGKQTTISLEYDRYNPFYHSGLIMRPSCIGCVYSSFDRVSDVTIGDFSKLREISPMLNRGCGLSTVLVNTKKGEELLDHCKDALTLYSCDVETVTQLRLQKGSVENAERAAFLRYVKEYGFIKARNRRYKFMQCVKIRVASWIWKGKK